MARVFSDNTIVSIDIGTTKICVLIAQKVGDSQLDIIGIGKAPSDGLRKGVVVDIARTIRSIKAAVKEAEVMAGIPVESAYIGISGAHIHSFNSQGAVPIKTGQVRPQDIANALDAAKAMPLREGQQILHVLPQYFTLDGDVSNRLQDPLGMHGVRLEVQVHIIAGAIASVQNLIKCCEQAGVKVADIILEQLASADAVLSDDERELGVAMLDIGGGTSDLAIYQHGSICHTMVLPVAGNHLTHDVAIGLRVGMHEAERIKKEYGIAGFDYLTEDKQISIELVQGGQAHTIKQSDVINIIEPRIQELFMLINQDIDKHNLRPYITSGLVLTGGGSLLKFAGPLAEKIFNIPVRVGAPKKPYQMPEILENPIYATGYGLLVHALKKEQKAATVGQTGPWAQRVTSRMKSWIADFF